MKHLYAFILACVACTSRIPESSSVAAPPTVQVAPTPEKSASGGEPTRDAAEPSLAASPPPGEDRSTPIGTMAYAIRLLEQHRYAELLEQLSLPEYVQKLRDSGRFQKVVERFESSWGPILLEKLKRAVKRPPNIRNDGSLEFDVHRPDADYAPLDSPIVLTNRDGKWFFTD